MKYRLRKYRQEFNIFISLICLFMTGAGMISAKDQQKQVNPAPLPTMPNSAVQSVPVNITPKKTVQRFRPKVNSPIRIPQSWTPTVRIDITKQFEPISPYIYGQFIEHLGRCIYGGIWAEMLEDRKFYEPVNSKTSPWKSPNKNGTLRMVEKDPYVGKWTPELTATPFTGYFHLCQEGIELKPGVDFTGYAIVKVTEGIKSVQIGLTTTKAEGISEAVHFKVGSNDLIPGKFVKLKFSFPFKDKNFTGPASFYIAAEGSGSLQIGTASLMPADNIAGMRADTLKLLRELNSPVYRWPGGNFVSGYNWKDGIGDRDRRPPRKNPAWKGIEHNDFGFDEFMTFCSLLKTEPYIAVNTGSGTLDSALEELQYANGSADLPMGKIRARNGHKDPYHVRFWCIGNEMYGKWQIGYMPVADYVKKHNAFVDAFRKFDKNISVVGVGNVGPWNDVFIPGALEHLDYLSEHFYVQERPDLIDHASLTVGHIKRIDQAHDDYEKKWSDLYGKRKLPVIMDEWNYWYGPEVFGEIGTRYYLRDGLGIATGLHEFFRHSDRYFMANYAQTVNVIGAIKTNKTNAEFESTGLVLKLYRNQFGTIPVQIETIFPDSEIPHNIIDVSAALDKNGKFLTIGFVNLSGDNVTVKLDLGSFNADRNAKMFVIADKKNDQCACNDPSESPRITITEKKISSGGKNIVIPKLSVTMIKLYKDNSEK